MNLEEIEAEVLKLQPDARAQLVEKLLQSLEALSDTENKQLSDAECCARQTSYGERERS